MISVIEVLENGFLDEKIKQKNPDSQQAFVEYVKTRLNENFELPF